MVPPDIAHNVDGNLRLIAVRGHCGLHCSSRKFINLRSAFAGRPIHHLSHVSVNCFSGARNEYRTVHVVLHRGFLEPGKRSTSLTPNTQEFRLKAELFSVIDISRDSLNRCGRSSSPQRIDDYLTTLTARVLCLGLVLALVNVMFTLND